jgi:uncharacterized protein YigE (DUF2233 family)
MDNGNRPPNIGQIADGRSPCAPAEGHDARCTRRRFLQGLGLAAGLFVAGTDLRADGPPIVTESRVIEGRNHTFVTTARHGRYLAKVVTALDVLGKPFATTPEILAATGAFVCFNGSFFEGDSSPSGLYVCDGLYKNPVTYDKGDGILYIDRARQIRIISKYHYAEHEEEIVDALQINLFTEGDLKLYDDKEYKRRLPRNLIGIGPDGVVDVIYKNTNFTLGDRYMKAIHGCTVVGALDGGSSASAVDRLGRASYREDLGDRGEAAVANFLILYEK